MTGLDTNVLVRYLAQDDALQSARATRLIERELSERSPGHVGLVVLAELCWVLKRMYGATPAELRETVRDLLEARQLVVEQRAVLGAALAGGGDLVDAIIAAGAQANGCDRVVTFDKAAVKAGMVALR
jgi:predicted nucleic-acid-binding protein